MGEELERLQEAMEEPTPIYNNDSVDVSPDEYDLDGEPPARKGSCLGIFILLLLLFAAGFVYLAWGGKLPW